MPLKNTSQNTSQKTRANKDSISSSPRPKKRAKRAVLGRGLESLFSPDSPDSSADSSPDSSALHNSPLKAKTQKKPGAVLSLGIEQIQANPNQPRRIFEKEFLKDLADSIKKNGLIQPVIVKKSGLKYQIIAGERRWRAAQQAGLHKIPVRVLDSDNVFLPLVENLQRQDLNPLELAQAYKKLLQEQKLTQEKLSDQLGLPRATLANQLRILKLPKKVQELILSGNLSLALAKILLQEKDYSAQIKWARYFARHKTGVRVAQKLISRSGKKASDRKASSLQKQATWQSQAIKKIQDIHGIKSRLKFKKKGGEFCLRFFSEEELKHVMDLLLKVKS